LVCPDLLDDVLLRVLDNARKFAAPERSLQIDVELGCVENYVTVTVTDNGIGLPLAVIPLIFEPFYQYNRDEREQQGLGIGLAIVKQAMKIMGGKIEVSSVVNEGSTFSLYFPVANPG